MIPLENEKMTAAAANHPAITANAPSRRRSRAASSATSTETPPMIASGSSQPP